MFDPLRRSAAPEWMDGDDVSAEDLQACMRDLAAVNTVTLGRRATLQFVKAACRKARGHRLRVLDIGCGDGDMLRRLRRWGARAGQPLALTGLDVNPLCIAAARRATLRTTGIAFHRGDAFGEWPGTFDVVISSLFTHHLSDPDVVRFLRLMEARASVGWFVNDLHRHALAFRSFGVLAWAAGWHRIVQHDGAVSVARSFSRSDWRALLAEAGIPEADIRWRLPFRYCVARLK